MLGLFIMAITNHFDPNVFLRDVPIIPLKSDLYRHQK